jgi:hypothetical protein
MAPGFHAALRLGAQHLLTVGARLAPAPTDRCEETCSWYIARDSSWHREIVSLPASSSQA